MGLFKRKQERKLRKYLTQQFKLINGYSASFSTYSGGMYEMELIRSAVESIATQCSKLNPVVVAGKKYKNLEKMLQFNPNRIMTTQQFLAKLVTILKVENNAFIIPIYPNQLSNEIVGLYPVSATGCRIESYENQEYLIYRIDNKEYVIEYERVGHLRNHYYNKQYWGSNNEAMNPTLNLIHTQNQGIIEGIKQSATIRFLAKLNNVLTPTDMAKEKQRFVDDNLSSSNNGGVLLFDSKYSDVRTVDSKPYIVDDRQAELIRKNVFNYFHISEGIIQNKANEDEWNSFYEGCIEPISIQLGQVLTKMLFTNEEIKRGYHIALESSKLQFASNNTKLQVSQQLFDRGIMTVNQVMDVWNLPHVAGGDKRYIRKEYTEVTNLDREPIEQPQEQQKEEPKIDDLKEKVLEEGDEGNGE